MPESKENSGGCLLLGALIMLCIVSSGYGFVIGLSVTALLFMLFVIAMQLDDVIKELKKLNEGKK